MSRNFCGEYDKKPGRNPGHRWGLEEDYAKSLRRNAKPSTAMAS
jgi:hypothetical protein